MGADKGSLSWWGSWEKHGLRMRRAAGVSSVKLICHGDTWTEIDSWFFGFQGDHTGRVPKDRVKARGDGTVEVTLSGLSLVGLLKVSHRRRYSPYPDMRAVARRAYEQVAKVIDAVDPEAKPGQAIPPIVLDDKLGDSVAN